MSDSDPSDTQRTSSRRVLVWKAAGLAVAIAVVGIALVVVLWLLITITFSLIGSL